MTISPSSLFLRLCLAGSIAALTACGGGGGSSSATPSATVLTGVLTDSEIKGVAYSTSSGRSGTTDAAGHFDYVAGDTVTFRIGQLVLGSYKPTGSSATVTPLELATTGGVVDADKVSNLLVLLQSLDSDGDASNGIEILPAVGTALTSTVAATLDLTEAPATFSGSSALSGLVSTAGPDAVLVSEAEAKEHFVSAFFQRIEGTWRFSAADTDLVIRFDGGGHYIMADIDPTLPDDDEDDDGGRNGVETGAIEWDPLTGSLTIDSIGVDSNGSWGLSNLEGVPMTLAVQDGKLVLTLQEEEDAAAEVLNFSRIEAASSGIVGTWGLQSGIRLDVAQIIFLANGKYFLLDPVGDEEDVGCGSPGLEYGSYSFSAGTLSFSAIVHDTNGCAGLHDTEEPAASAYASFGATINAQGHLELTEEDGGVTLYRAGVPPVVDVR
ncbi:MAG: hypothetical protein REI12_13960 [Pedobacter sp.]|nr:hypothetical protein [Pedobacter sp.]